MVTDKFFYIKIKAKEGAKEYIDDRCSVNNLLNKSFLESRVQDSGSNGNRTNCCSVVDGVDVVGKVSIARIDT